MTVAAAVTETTYNLVGTNKGPFATVFPFASVADVQVYLLETQIGYPRLLALGADYSISAPAPLVEGGEITLARGPAGAAWLGSDTLTLVRVSPDSQPASLGEVQTFSPRSAEDALDHLQRQIQDLRSEIAERVLYRPPGQTWFDTGSRAILGLAAATDDDAAVTVKQLRDAIFGSSVPAYTPAWAAITGKPATFPASPMAAANITDFEAALGAKLLAGAGVTITHTGGQYRFDAGAGDVTSVNGDTGAVVLGLGDLLGFKSIKDYGAVCDGVTDDKAAWNLAIADINGGLIGGVLVPGLSGVHGALNLISKPVAILGCGLGVSGLVHLAGSGDVTLMSIQIANAKQRVTIRDLSIMSAQANSGQALYITTSFGSIAMANVDVRGNNDTHLAFNRGIETVGATNSTFHNVNVYGYDDGVSSFPNNYLQMAWAWYCHVEIGKAAFNTRWTNCDVTRCITAWKCRNHLEGYSWVTCNPVAVGETWNIQVSDSANAPYFAWVNCQQEYYNTGITVDNAAWVMVNDCQFYSDGYLGTDRRALNISNTIGVQASGNLLIPINGGAPAGTDSFAVFTNCQRVKTNHNLLMYFNGIGIKWTGTSQDCSSYFDVMYNPAAGATVYKNDAASPLLNRRRSMEIVGATDTQGKQSALVENNTPAAVTSTQAPVVQVPFAVEPGDRLRVTLDSYVNYTTAETMIIAVVREYNHRPSAGTPYQVLQHVSVNRVNWIRTEHLTAVKFDANFGDVIEFDVIAGASDGLISLELRSNQAGVNGNMNWAYMKVDRL